MLERDAQLALLLDAVSRLRAGEGGVAIVSGEAGIGKSTLLDAFIAALPAEVRLLRGWCDNLVTAHPLGPIREAIRGRPGSLVPSPELDQALSAGEVPAVLTGLTAALGHGRPAVLVIEDLHWADDATLDVLAYLARRLEQLRLLLVVSLRPEDSSSVALRRFLGGLPARGTVRVELSPLSRAAVAELNDGGVWNTDELFRVTGGNAFYVTEALAGSPAGGVPQTVTDAVLARLHRTGEACQRALEHLSVWSGELPHELAEAVLGDDLDGLAEAETGRAGDRHQRWHPVPSRTGQAGHRALGTVAAAAGDRPAHGRRAGRLRRPAQAAAPRHPVWRRAGDRRSCADRGCVLGPCRGEPAGGGLLRRSPRGGTPHAAGPTRRRLRQLRLGVAHRPPVRRSGRQRPARGRAVGPTRRAPRPRRRPCAGWPANCCWPASRGRRWPARNAPWPWSTSRTPRIARPPSAPSARTMPWPVIRGAPNS